jgi:threonine dehydratase
MQATSIAMESISITEEVIRPYIRRTPVVEVSGMDIGVDCPKVSLKLELLQHTGSFKPRGAFANLLTHDIPEAGVVAASGGNHGAAVAYAAKTLGVAATIFVPRVSSPAKVDRIRSYGAKLEITGDRYVESLAESERWAADSGALQVHAYDQRETLLGQGTVASEFEAQCPDLQTVLVAVGGGGLIGGVAAWYRGRVKLIGVEPEGAPTLEHALRAGHPVDAPAGSIAADSLAPARVGSMMFPLAQAYVDRVVLVSDAHIERAQRKLWDLLRIATEPGGAAAFAALASGRYQPHHDERLGVVICGGNTTAVSFAA